MLIRCYTIARLEQTLPPSLARLGGGLPADIHRVAIKNSRGVTIVLTTFIDMFLVKDAYQHMVTCVIWPLYTPHIWL